MIAFAAEDGGHRLFGMPFTFVLRYPLLITRLDMFLVCAHGTIAPSVQENARKRILPHNQPTATGDSLLLPGFSFRIYRPAARRAGDLL